MENTVTIQNTRENVFDFEINAEGVDGIESARVCLVIETKEALIGFRAERGDGNKWSVKIPVMPQLEKTVYPFHIEVIIDGYYFETLRGLMNVVPSPEIYTTQPKNITLQPAVNSQTPAQPSQTPPSIIDQQRRSVAAESEDKMKKSAEKIANKILSEVNNGSKPKTQAEEKKTKDDLVHTILEGMKSKEDHKKSSVRFKKRS